jgi:hypothetical protein
VEPIFDFPVIAHQLQDALGGSLTHREIAQARDDLVADLSRFENAGGAFQSK